MSEAPVEPAFLRRMDAAFDLVCKICLILAGTALVVMTTIFYGYGFGLYGQVPRAAQMLFVAAMLGFQLWFSKYWLTAHRYGPAEWLWRTLTYGKLQAIKKAS